MNKKWCKLGSIFLMVLAMSIPTSAATHSDIIIDGYNLSEDAKVLTVANRKLVPFREVFNIIGASVDWNPSTKTLTTQKGKKVVTLTLNSKTALVDGKKTQLSTAPIQKNGITYVPLRFVTEVFGGLVDIDKHTGDTNIYSEGVALSKLPIKSIIEPLGLATVIVKSADLNNDKVRDYVVVACEPDDMSNPMPSNTPMELIVVDGKTGAINDREIMAYHWTDEISLSIVKSDTGSKIIYDRGYGKKTIFDYKGTQMVKNNKSLFIKNNKIVVDKGNIGTLFSLSMNEAKQMFGTSSDPWFEVYPAHKQIGLNYEGNPTPYCVVLFPGSEFMGLNFSESPAQVKSKWGQPTSEGWSDKDQSYSMDYEILGHYLFITFSQSGNGIFSIAVFNL